MKRNIILASIFSITSTMGLLGCGNSNSSSATLDGVAYVTVGSSSLSATSGTISGTGSLVFLDPLTGIASKHSFALTFSLTDGGTVTLSTHANEALEGGINIVFRRSGSSLIATVGSDATVINLGSGIPALDDSTQLTFQIDAHNDEEPPHLLIWTGTDFDEGAAVYNSEEDGPVTLSNAAGTFWGLSLENATLETAAVSAPKFVEGE